MSFEEVLLTYKHEVDPLRVIFLIEDYSAMKVCAAFPYATVKYKAPKEDPDPDLKLFEMGDQIVDGATGRDWYWKFLWSRTNVDVHELSQIAGVAFDRTENFLCMLQRSKMVFPDGTIHNTARRIIGAYIQKKVESL